jgi:hypothetical protein
MKRISISRLFPVTHQRKWEPTNFAEKILNNLKIDYRKDDYFSLLKTLNPTKKEATLFVFFKSLDANEAREKYQTIRSGHWHKANDLFCPYVWSNPKRPYNEHQIIFAPPIQINSPSIVTTTIDTPENVDATGSEILYIDGNEIKDLNQLANYDGLSENDFIDWFELSKPKKKLRKGPFDGQAIVWDASVSYF